ncbi:MAG: kelch repeat-containing protein, partial [Pseudomonadota bacterium]
ADPTSGQWEEARPLPVPRAEAVTLYKDGQIHMIGGRSPGPANEGWSDQRDTGFHHIYDPKADKWEEAAPMPVPRNSSTGAVIGNTIYIVSGRTVKSGNTPFCHAYDTATDVWREVAPIPVPERQPAPHGQGGLAGGAFNGKLYAFGGEWFKGQLSPDDDGGVYADTWEYNPVADTWRPVAEMIRPRHGLGGVSIEGFGSVDGMYAIGGAARPSGSGVTPHLDRFVI